MAEPYLGNAKNTIEVIRKYDFAFQKRFGQNFLVDSHVLEKIVRSADIKEEDCILEIGPGIGTLTQYLASSAKKVIAVEIDKNLISVLNDTLKEWDNVEILNEDILKVDLKKLSEEKNQGNRFKVVANLPYYITTPVIMNLLEMDFPVDSITLMIQKEVAERIQAGPGSKEYGALSLAVQYYSDAHVTAKVPCNCFIPRPKVDSEVIHLQKYEKPPVKVKNRELMFNLIRASFNQRRKTLANGIKNAQNLPFGKEEVEEAIRKCGFSPSVRGEQLSLQDFADLADAFS